MAKVDPIEVARECLKRSRGGWKAAARRFRKKMNEDAALRAEILEPLIERAIWDLLREADHGRRSAITRGSVPRPMPGPGATSSAEALGRAADRRLADFPLQGGVRLGSSCRSEVEAMRAVYGRNRRGNAIGEEWMRRIASRLPVDDSKVVDDVFTEESLREARETAEESVS